MELHEENGWMEKEEFAVEPDADLLPDDEGEEGEEGGLY